MTRRARALSAPAVLAEQPSTTAPTGRRITFVDLLRLLASFQMVTGHTIDSLLHQDLRQGGVFDRWSFVRGLTSVAFMVAAGMSYHFSTLARFEVHKGDPANVRRRLRRGVWLVVVGYLLRFPWAAFSGDPALAARALDAAMIADVLQCIGLSILALEGLTLVARRPMQVVWAAGVLGGLAFALAPLFDPIGPEGPWQFALNYLTHRGGSLFPLLPWAGFVFAGVVIAQAAVPNGARTDPATPPVRLAACAIGILAMAYLAELSPWTFASAETARNALPAFSVLKLGLVAAFVALLALAGRHLSRLPKPLETLAGESLMLYVFHLVVLYEGTIGLYRLFGHALDLPAAVGVAGVMVLVSAAVALGWNRVKRALRPPRPVGPVWEMGATRARPARTL